MTQTATSTTQFARKLAEFRQSHPLQTIPTPKTEWTYYAQGNKFPQIVALSRTFGDYTRLATILAHQQSAQLVLDFLQGDAYNGI